MAGTAAATPDRPLQDRVGPQDVVQLPLQVDGVAGHFPVVDQGHDLVAHRTGHPRQVLQQQQLHDRADVLGPHQGHRHGAVDIRLHTALLAEVEEGLDEGHCLQLTVKQLAQDLFQLPEAVGPDVVDLCLHRIGEGRDRLRRVALLLGIVDAVPDLGMTGFRGDLVHDLLHQVAAAGPRRQPCGGGQGHDVRRVAGGHHRQHHGILEIAEPLVQAEEALRVDHPAFIVRHAEGQAVPVVLPQVQREAQARIAQGIAGVDGRAEIGTDKLPRLALDLDRELRSQIGNPVMV